MNAESTSATIYELDQERAQRSLEAGDAGASAGAFLKAARLAAGIELGDASTKTHIKADHLEAIEAMNFDALPARPYTLGFIRTYAEFLELDGKAVVDRFKQDMNIEQSDIIEPAADLATSAPVERSDLSLLAVVGVIAFVSWCAWQITMPKDANLSTPVFAGRALQSTSIGDDRVLDVQVVEETRPIYPRSCLEGAGANESVVVGFTITVAGRVSAEQVLSSTNPCFNESALYAVRRWRFEASRGGDSAKPIFDQKVTVSFPRPR